MLKNIMIHIKEQKNGINDINDTKLLDLIKQNPLILRSYLNWLDHPFAFINLIN